jgi:predicted RNase H-like nuclease
MRLAGVDGCPDGWVAAIADWSPAGFAWVGWEVDRPGAALPALASTVVIDIPMGLPAQGRRPLESVVRRRLSRRGSCVFPTPVRSVLEATSYEEACALSRRDCDGLAISKQTFFLLPRIKDVDGVDGLIEGHPELTLSEMAGHVVLSKKRTLEGRHERTALLTEALGFPVAELIQRRGSARPDDLLDAMALLWTAQRWATGTAIEFDDGPDALGRPMRIAL